MRWALLLALIAARGIIRRRELPPNALLKIGRRIRILRTAAMEGS